MYSKPIQYLNDLFENEETKGKVARNNFLIKKLIDLYMNNDIESIRAFSGYVNFITRTSEYEHEMHELKDELIYASQLMIQEIQATIYKDKTNGLRLVK
jgi:hypothetical protein